MRIKDGFELKKIAGENVVVSSDGTPMRSSIKLTAVTAFMWNTVKRTEASKEQLLNAVLDNFDISTVLALSDIDIFVKTLKENGILEE